MKMTMPLMNLLQQPLPHVLARRVDDNPDERANHFRLVADIRPWKDFTLETILSRYSDVLTNAKVEVEIMRNNDVHPPALQGKADLFEKIDACIFPPIHLALQSAHAYRAAEKAPVDRRHPPRAEIVLDTGDTVRRLHGLHADLAFFKAGVQSALNRVPGVVRTSWFWCSQWQHGPAPAQYSYLSTLTEANYYMHLYGARHGFVLTDCELIALKGSDDHRIMYASRPIRWTDEANAADSGKPCLTALLALWYLGMLAGVEDGEERWWTRRARETDPYLGSEYNPSQDGYWGSSRR